MWEETKASSGGGFLNSPSGQFASPAGGSSEKRPDRIQNVVPVHCSAITETPPDHNLTVGGQDVHMAVLCGQLEAIDRAATKLTYTLKDHTGSVSAVRWLDAEASPDTDLELSEGMLCRMIARVRAGKGGGPPNVICFHLQQVSEEEQQVHRLEVRHAVLKIQHAAQLASGGGGAAGGGLVNSTAGVGGGGGEVPMVVGGGIVGLTPQQQVVYGSIHACPNEQGVHRDQLYSSVTGKLPRSEVDRILEYLSNEGHIYNTSDDDHFKATDC